MRLLDYLVNLVDFFKLFYSCFWLSFKIDITLVKILIYYSLSLAIFLLLVRVMFNIMFVMAARRILVMLQGSFGILSRKEINLMAIYIAYSQVIV